jgi:hypothetical protein
MSTDVLLHQDTSGAKDSKNASDLGKMNVQLIDKYILYFLFLTELLKIDLNYTS